MTDRQPRRAVHVLLVVCALAGSGLWSQPIAAVEDALRLTPHIVRDPMVNNVEAFRFLMPPDWQVQGGVVWRHDLSNLAHAKMLISAPDGRTAIELFPIMPYSWPPPAPIGGVQHFKPGGNYLGNLLYAPVEPGVFITRYIAPGLRGQFKWRLVSRTPLTKVVETIAKSNQPMAGLAFRVLGEKVRIEYRLPDGSMMEEDFYLIFTYTTSTVGITRGSTWWLAHQFYSFRAPKGQLDRASNLMHTMVASTQISIKWFNAYMQVRQMAHEGRLAAIKQAGELSRKIAQVGDEIREINRQAYENQQRSRDEMHRQFTNYIRGVEQYNTPHSSYPVSLPSQYKHAWVSNTGQYVMSNNANFNPNEQGGTQTYTRLKVYKPQQP